MERRMVGIIGWNSTIVQCTQNTRKQLNAQNRSIISKDFSKRQFARKTKQQLSSPLSSSFPLDPFSSFICSTARSGFVLQYLMIFFLTRSLAHSFSLYHFLSARIFHCNPKSCSFNFDCYMLLYMLVQFIVVFILFINIICVNVFLIPNSYNHFIWSIKSVWRLSRNRNLYRCRNETHDYDTALSTKKSHTQCT